MITPRPSSARPCEYAFESDRAILCKSFDAGMVSRAAQPSPAADVYTSDMKWEEGIHPSIYMYSSVFFVSHHGHTFSPAIIPHAPCIHVYVRDAWTARMPAHQDETRGSDSKKKKKKAHNVCRSSCIRGESDAELACMAGINI